jgi:hypothetical protein
LIIYHEVFEQINALVFLKDFLDFILFGDVFLWVYLYFLSDAILSDIEHFFFIILCLLFLDVVANDGVGLEFR